MTVHRFARSLPRGLVLWLYGIATFLGAFLLFQVQPILGKAILPWFGGGASIWTTCLIFFQLALLVGYLYAHLLGRAIRPAWRLRVHLLLMLGALATLPILPSASWKPDSPQHPVLWILALLGVNIGLPYVVLAATSPMVQDWLAQDFQEIQPYRFYALSNLGSLLGLGSYPILTEPLLTLKAQSQLWSLLFLLYALIVAGLALRRSGEAPPRPEEPIPVAEPSAADPGNPWLWLALACLPSALLLSVTSHLSTNIAPIPFLWVLPLGLYLLSFILAFDHPRWYPRRAMRALAFPALFLMAFYASEQQQLVSIWKTIPIYCACFFLVCFVGNGELARLKPPKAGLTRFYLMIAAGGSLGSLLVGVAAPLLFPAAYELLLILIAFAILLPIVMKRSAAGGSSTSRTRIAVAAAAGVASVFAGFVLIQRIQMVGESHRAVRSFYGTLQVLDEGKGEDRYRSLIDGVIDHGCQFTAPSRQDQLTTYFGPGSGAALAFAALGDRPRRVGIVGLGAGTLAAYGRPGDRFDFFELNPDVVDIARRDFTFLARSRAEIQVRIGDGRLLLERLPDQNYDLIVLDAFSSDAVPVHLLTREAFASYGRHLRKGGLLCANISNRYLDLRPVLHGVAAAQGKSAWVVRSEGDLSLRRASAVFVLMTDAAGRSALAQAGSPLPETSPRQPWTDDHTNLFPLLKVFAPNQSVNKP